MRYQPMTQVHRIFILLPLLLFSATLSAQVRDMSYLVNWTEEMKSYTFYHNSVESQVLDDGTILVYRSNAGSGATRYFFHRFESDLTAGPETELALKEDGTWFEARAEIIYNNRFYFLYTTHEKKADHATIYLREVSLTDFTLVGDPIKVGDIPWVYAKDFRITLSDNEEYMLIDGDYQERLLSKSGHFFAFVLDENLDLVREYATEFPFPPNSNQYAIWVSDQGTLTGFARIYVGPQARGMWTKYGAEDHTHSMFRFDENTGKAEFQNLDLGGLFIASVYPGMAPNGDFLLHGIYRGNEPNRIEGNFYARIDRESLEVTKMQHKPLGDVLMNRFDKYVGWARVYEHQVSIVYRHQLFYPDGGMLVIAEGLEGENLTDLLITYIDENGDISWSHRVPKEQEGSNRFNSFALVYEGTQVYLLFGDDKRNYRKGEFTPGQPYDGGKGVIVMVDVNRTGELNTSLLTDPEEKFKPILLPGLSLRLPNGKVLLFHVDGSKVQLGTLPLFEQSDSRG